MVLGKIRVFYLFVFNAIIDSGLCYEFRKWKSNIQKCRNTGERNQKGGGSKIIWIFVIETKLKTAEQFQLT